MEHLITKEPWSTPECDRNTPFLCVFFVICAPNYCQTCTRRAQCRCYCQTHAGCYCQEQSLCYCARVSARTCSVLLCRFNASGCWVLLCRRYCQNMQGVTVQVLTRYMGLSIRYAQREFKHKFRTLSKACDIKILKSIKIKLCIDFSNYYNYMSNGRILCRNRFSMPTVQNGETKL